jgi:hypothetical protein
MNRVRVLVLASCVLTACAPALAEETRLPVPGQGFGVRFEGPAFARIEESSGPAQYKYLGNAGRFFVSFIVEPPKCPGGNTQEKIYDCFNTALKHNPYVVYETERGNTLPDGKVLVAYMTQADGGGHALRAFNLNVLFAHGEKWGDVHLSVVQPKPEDVDALLKMAQSVDVVDDSAQAPAPAPSAPASAATD